MAFWLKTPTQKELSDKNDQIAILGGHIVEVECELSDCKESLQNAMLKIDQLTELLESERSTVRIQQLEIDQLTAVVNRNIARVMAETASVQGKTDESSVS